MASENLVNGLFEIIQSNTKEKLSYVDFEKDLLKSIKLPNDEIDRALSLILSQAEVNPNVIGETKGGTFIVSQSLSASVVSTIKYENQFIEGKEEYILRNNSKENIIDISASTLIMSNELFNNMIKSYNDLSSGERDALWASYGEMDDETRDALRDAQNNMLKELYNNPNLSPEEKEAIGNSLIASQHAEQVEKGTRKKIMDPHARYKAIEDAKYFKEVNPEVFEQMFSSYGEIDLMTDDQLRDIVGFINMAIGIQDAQLISFTQAKLERNAVLHNDKTPIEDGYDKNGYNGQPKMDVTLRSGKQIFGVKKEDITLTGKSLKEFYRNRSLLDKPTSKMYLMTCLNGILESLNIDESGRESVLQSLIKAVKTLPQETLDDPTSDLYTEIIGSLTNLNLLKEIEPIKSILEQHGDLVLAIRENRDAVVSDILEPYKAYREGDKDFDKFVEKLFPSINKEERDRIRASYQEYFISEGMIYNPSTEAQVYIETNENLPQSKEAKTTKHYLKRITEEEYERANPPQEEMLVDQEGLKQRVKAGEAKVSYTEAFGDLTTDDEWSGFGFSDYTGVFSGITVERPKKEDEEIEVEPKESEPEISGDKEEIGENNDIMFETPNNRGVIFSPFNSEKAKNALRKARISMVVGQTEVLKEAMKRREQERQEVENPEVEEIGE